MKSGGGPKRPVTMLDMAMFRENADAIRADHDRRGIPHDSIDAVSYTHLTLPTKA